MVLLFLTGCTKQSIEELRDELPVLTGVLRSNSTESLIDFFTLNEEYAGNPIRRNARLFVEGAGQNLEWSSNNYQFSSPGDFVFMPDSTYAIRVYDEKLEQEVSCKITMPPFIQLIAGITDTIRLSAPGSVAGLISWNALDNDRFSYVFRLECLEKNPNQIPGEYGLFDERYTGPQLSPQLLMLKSDFKYYGRHKLTVLAIDRSLDALFFFDPADMRSQLRNGPRNVSGAAGFVAGVTGFETEIIILE